MAGNLIEAFIAMLKEHPQIVVATGPLGALLLLRPIIGRSRGAQFLLFAAATWMALYVGLGPFMREVRKDWSYIWSQLW